MIEIKGTQAALGRGLQRSAALPQRRTLETPAGTLVLQQHCSPSLVAELSADRGLHAFARSPEREHSLLLNIARRPDSALTLAYTLTGEIVGQVTIAPCDAWGSDIANIYEIAIEVGSQWRRFGLARQLLSFALELEGLEDLILLGIGLSWHWDTEGLKLTACRYRRLIADLFAPHGFVEYPTTDPEICMHPANILLARIGGRVDQQIVVEFMNRLLSWPIL